MHTYESLYDALKNMHIDPRGTLLVHSSMKSIGQVEGGAETVLDVLCDYMKEGLLVFPTHTWNILGEDQAVYDARSTPSCVGLLTKQFLLRPGVIRSLHPTHSVAALGREAEAFTAGEERMDTPCPKNGCWGRLYDRGAAILFIGCGMNRNTYIHSVEEWNNVPDRLSVDTVPLTIIDALGRAHRVDMHRHSCLFTDDVSQYYSKLEAPFLKLGALQQATFGDARCLLGNAREMGDITSGFLQKDMALFAGDKAIPTQWY